MNLLRKTLSMILPPIIKNLYLKICVPFYGFYKNFDNWNSAEQFVKRRGNGYDAGLILKKVKESTNKVLNGEAVFERDGVCFYVEDYNYEMTSALLYILCHDQKLKVIDFGGALGSTYFQNRKIFPDISVAWNVVEQKHYVDYGRECINELHYFYSIPEALADNKHEINCLLFSGVLQYLDDPYKFMEDILQYKIKYLLIDRVPFYNDEDDQVVIQKVSPQIYNAEYPVWLLQYSKFINFYIDDYEKIFEWDAHDKIPIKKFGSIEYVGSKGVLLKLKDDKNI